MTTSHIAVLHETPPIRAWPSSYLSRHCPECTYYQVTRTHLDPAVHYCHPNRLIMWPGIWA